LIAIRHHQHIIIFDSFTHRQSTSTARGDQRTITPNNINAKQHHQQQPEEHEEKEAQEGTKTAPPNRYCIIVIRNRSSSM